MKQDLLTPREVARRLSVSVRTVYSWIREGRVPSVRLSERCTRVPARAVEVLMAGGRPQGTVRTTPGAADRERPDLSSVLWDVDGAKVDEVVHARFLIERILETGDDEQVRWMLGRYPRDQVADVARVSRRLSCKSSRSWQALLAVLPRQVPEGRT